MTLVIEVLVLRLALAKTHQLHTTNHQFYFVVGIFYDLVKYSLGFCVLHLCDVVESHVFMACAHSFDSKVANERAFSAYTFVESKLL